MSHFSETLLVAPSARTEVYRKISWRIMPFIVLCYLCGHLLHRLLYFRSA
jgi:hypothetical protein